MNSFKSTMTVLFLLFVSYAVYRVIHTPDPLDGEGDEYFVNIDDSPRPSEPPLLRGVEEDQGVESAAGEFADMEPASPPMAPPLMASPETRDPGAGLGVAAADRPSSAPQAAERIDAGASAMSGSVQPAGGLQPIVPAGEAASDSSAGVMTGPLTEVASAAARPTSELANAPPAAAPAPKTPLAEAWAGVDGHLRNGQIAEALRLLSGYYRVPLGESERNELLRWLDALAFKVIYSTENQLEPLPHVVQAGETFESLAGQWGVPAELIRNINRSKIPADGQLFAGLELKVVRGPFRAELDSARGELTLFLGDLYAGRFPVNASGGSAQAGAYVLDKRAGQVADPAAAGYRMEFAGGVGLVASEQARPGDFRLAAGDARDLFGILSPSSPISIMR